MLNRLKLFFTKKVPLFIFFFSFAFNIFFFILGIIYKQEYLEKENSGIFLLFILCFSFLLSFFVSFLCLKELGSFFKNAFRLKNTEKLDMICSKTGRNIEFIVNFGIFLVLQITNKLEEGKHLAFINTSRICESDISFILKLKEKENIEIFNLSELLPGYFIDEQSQQTKQSN